MSNQAVSTFKSKVPLFAGYKVLADVYELAFSMDSWTLPFEYIPFELIHIIVSYRMMICLALKNLPEGYGDWCVCACYAYLLGFGSAGHVSNLFKRFPFQNATKGILKCKSLCVFSTDDVVVPNRRIYSKIPRCLGFSGVANESSVPDIPGSMICYSTLSCQMNKETGSVDVDGFYNRYIEINNFRVLFLPSVYYRPTGLLQVGFIKMLSYNGPAGPSYLDVQEIYEYDQWNVNPFGIDFRVSHDSFFYSKISNLIIHITKAFRLHSRDRDCSCRALVSISSDGNKIYGYGAELLIVIYMDVRIIFKKKFCRFIKFFPDIMRRSDYTVMAEDVNIILKMLNEISCKALSRLEGMSDYDFDHCICLNLFDSSYIKVDLLDCSFYNRLGAIDVVRVLFGY